MVTVLLFNSTKMKSIGHTQPWVPFVFSGLILMGAMVITGCSKSQTASTQAAGPLAMHGTVTNGQPNLPELQRDVIRWVVGNHRMPTNFDEFASTAGVAIPPPPPGQIYVIDSKMHVGLAKQ